jgi:hypothetical protein
MIDLSNELKRFLLMDPEKSNISRATNFVKLNVKLLLCQGSHEEEESEIACIIGLFNHKIVEELNIWDIVPIVIN